MIKLGDNTTQSFQNTTNCIEKVRKIRYYVEYVGTQIRILRIGESMKMKKVRSVLLAAALTCSMIVTPVMAAPDDTTSLQNQKESAQNEVNGLQAQLNELFTKTNDLETQLINKGQEITKAQEDLAVAEEKKQQQYEDMKLRIKYMYEEGDTSALERIVASGSISEMLTQTEYVEKVHTYDRDKLREYAETVQEVEDLKTSLESDMTKLQNLDEEYKTQTAELSSTIESKRAEVSNLDAMIQEAARAAVEAAKKEQEKNNTVNNENTNTPSGGGDNSGGTVTPAPEPTPTPTPDTDTDTNSGSDTNSDTDTGTKLQSIYRKCHCRSCIQLGRKSGIRMGSM